MKKRPGQIFESVFFYAILRGFAVLWYFFKKNKNLVFLLFSVISHCVLYATIFMRITLRAVMPIRDNAGMKLQVVMRKFGSAVS